MANKGMDDISLLAAIQGLLEGTDYTIQNFNFYIDGEDKNRYLSIQLKAPLERQDKQQTPVVAKVVPVHTPSTKPPETHYGALSTVELAEDEDGYPGVHQDMIRTQKEQLVRALQARVSSMPDSNADVLTRELQERVAALPEAEVILQQASDGAWVPPGPSILAGSTLVIPAKEGSLLDEMVAAVELTVDNATTVLGSSDIEPQEVMVKQPATSKHLYDDAVLSRFFGEDGITDNEYSLKRTED